MKVAHYEKRILSYLIDFILPLTMSILIYYFWLIKIINLKDVSFILTIVIVSPILFFIVNVILMRITNGYTIGNFIFGIKTIASDQERIRLKHCLIKYAFLSFPICILLNAIYMLVVHSQITIFDTISNTNTISIRFE